LTLDNEGIIKLLEDLDKESKAIKRSLLKMCWYMRGSMTLEDAWATSHNDRQLINEIISENLEVTKETGMPFF